MELIKNTNMTKLLVCTLVFNIVQSVQLVSHSEMPTWLSFIARTLCDDN